MASTTTKQIATNTFNPNDCDIVSVVLDFVDEIQTAILQVKLNLTREYERRKLEYARSKAGQLEDIQKLSQASEEQDKETAETIKQVSEDEDEWKQAQLLKLGKLLDTFNSIDKGEQQTKYIQSIKTTLDTDKNIQKLSEPKKVDMKKLIGEIKGIVSKEFEQTEKTVRKMAQ